MSDQPITPYQEHLQSQLKLMTDALESSLKSRMGLENYIADLVRENHYLKDAFPAWEPISKIPKGVKVLCTDGEKIGKCILSETHENLYSEGCSGPSHWMPLPEPPEQSETNP